MGCGFMINFSQSYPLYPLNLRKVNAALPLSRCSFSVLVPVLALIFEMASHIYELKINLLKGKSQFVPD